MAFQWLTPHLSPKANLHYVFTDSPEPATGVQWLLQSLHYPLIAIRPYKDVFSLDSCFQDSVLELEYFFYDGFGLHTQVKEGASTATDVEGHLQACNTSG